MNFQSKSAKVLFSIGGIIVIFAGIYLLSVLIPENKGKRPDVVVDPNIIGNEGALEFGMKYADDYSEPSEELSRLFSTLKSSQDSQERQSVAFRISYLANNDFENELTAFLSDEDVVVAQYCAEALIRLWQKSDSNRASRFFNLAMNAWQSGEFAKAEIRLQNMANLNPETPDMYRLLAAARQKQGKYQEAIQAAEKALKMQPNHFAAQLIIAQCYIELNDPEAAEKYLDKALELYPTYPEALEIKEKHFSASS